MAQNYTAEELNKLGQKELVSMVLSLQDQVGKLNDNLERLIEQIRISNSNLYGRRTERLDQIAGQYSLFDEAEAYAEEPVDEPGEEEVIITVKKKKKAGKREVISTDDSFCRRLAAVFLSKGEEGHDPSLSSG